MRHPAVADKMSIRKIPSRVEGIQNLAITQEAKRVIQPVSHRPAKRIQQSHKKQNGRDNQQNQWKQPYIHRFPHFHKNAPYTSPHYASEFTPTFPTRRRHRPLTISCFFKLHSASCGHRRKTTFQPPPAFSMTI